MTASLAQQMKAHVAAADEKRALHAELQSLREYCTSLWMKGEHAAAADGVSDGRKVSGRCVCGACAALRIAAAAASSS